MLLRPGRAAARRLFSEFPVAARKGKMAALARQAEDEFASKGPLGILGASRDCGEPSYLEWPWFSPSGSMERGTH